MNESRVLIIGVIYKTYPETLRYLQSLIPLATGNFTVILVDNSEAEPPPVFMEKIRDRAFVHYIKTGKNLGYFGGAREGLSYYMKEYFTYPKWILVTNVDIVFTPSFFTKLNELNDQQNLGMLAPSIISQKWKRDLNPKIQERNSKRKIQFFQFLYANFLIQNLYFTSVYLYKWMKSRMHGQVNLVRDPGQKGRKIFAPHGSCFVFRDSYFKLGGTLDLPNFLFGEEIFVAETSARLGLDVVYDPELVIRDYEHASVGFFVTPKINKFYRESIQNILKLYYR